MNELEKLDIKLTFSGRKVYIHKDRDKSYGIKTLLDNIETEYSDNDIVTVGDSSLDVNMVKDYNGYCMSKGKINEYLSSDFKRTPNMRKLIKTISKTY